MKVLLPKLIKRLWYIAAAVIILAALFVSTMRLLTPYFNNHLPDFEYWASDILKAPVSIKNVYVTWDVYEPVIVFDQVKFIDKKTHKPSFQIGCTKINLSILRSLLARKLLVESITISGAHVTVHQVKSGQWNIEGLTGLQVTDNMTGFSFQGNAVLTWIFSIPQLKLQDVNLLFYPETGNSLSFSFVQLALENADMSHALSGKVILDQAISTRLNLYLTWKGEVTDLSHVSAHAYAYLEAVNLPQWIGHQVWHDLQIKQGLGSLKIWADWNNEGWQKVQSRMQFYDVQVQSTITKKIQAITRFNGDLGWRQEGEKQIIAGEQIFLDLPEHLWPVTSFFFQMAPDVSKTQYPVTPNVNKTLYPVTSDVSKMYYPEILRVSYVDLVDLNKVASTIGFLTNNIKNQFMSFNPRGIITDFQYQNLSSQALAFPFSKGDENKLSLKAIFSKLTLNPVSGYPGVNNASGAISWDGKEGNINLSSLKTTINLNALFPNELQFDRLTAVAKFKHDEKDAWSLDIKNLIAVNADANVHLKMGLILPSNDSPQINLSGDFSVLQANHLMDYIPIKKIDSELADWLRQAFTGGRFDSGKVLIQGRIADIPFDHDNGKFMVSCDANNVDFNFAPKWPGIRHLSGSVVFSGRKATIDVDSGEIANVPIYSVHGEIPYIGEDQPQILSVQSEIKTDLAHLMHFVISSPLQMKIGALSQLHFTGAADLKLGLRVPLKTPDKTQVQGDLLFPDATLSMPEWRFALQRLQGSVHFTENDIEAKELRGQLFNEVATLNLITQHPINMSSYVQANLQTQVDLGQLQTVFKIPTSSYITGKTSVAAELHLYSQDVSSQTNEASIYTNLKGATLHFPEPYGKKAEEARDLQIDVLLKKQSVRAKVNYNKLLTAALDFQRDTQGLHFYSGEVALGDDAKWQTVPGLLLSGDFKQLDWQTLQDKFAAKTSLPGIDLSFFRGIHLNVDILSILGQQLNDVQVDLTKQNALWLVNLNSREVVGQLNVLLTGPKPSISGRFSRLYLKPSTIQNKNNLNPGKIPSLSLKADEVQYNQKNLGAMSLNTVSSRSQLMINELSIESPLVNMHAQGSWQLNRSTHTSHLSGTLSTSRLSDLLKTWDAGSDNFVGSHGDVTFDLTWPDMPYQPGVKGLSGNISISLGTGRVINVGESNNAKMDLGRVLNLFSISSIPRRLTLDFSDVTQKGYGFDYIKGDFNLKNGNAFTQNAHSDGPIARIDISGRIGLVAKDLDVVVGVTPHVSTSSLPAVMMLWNPVAAAATFVAGQVAGAAMSKSSLYHYTVTGSWDDPSWQASH